MIGDLKAENTILKEANEKLVNRLGQFLSRYSILTRHEILYLLLACAVCIIYQSYITVFKESTLICFIAVLLTRRGKDSTGQSIDKWRYVYAHTQHHVHHTFRYISLPSSSLFQPNILVWTVYRRRDGEVFFLFLNLGVVSMRACSMLGVQIVGTAQRDVRRKNSERLVGWGRVWEFSPSLCFFVLLSVFALHYLNAWNRRIIIRFWETTHLPLP